MAGRLKLAGDEVLRAWFSIPKALGERGEQCESVPNHKRGRGGGFREGSRWRHEHPVGARGTGTPGHDWPNRAHREEEGGKANSLEHLARLWKVLRGTRHGRRPWSSPELRGQYGGVRRFTRKIDGEEAGEEGSSTAQRMEAEKARIGGMARDGRGGHQRRFFYCPGARLRLRVQEWGGGEGSGVGNNSKSREIERRGRGRGIVGVGAGFSFLCARTGGNGWGRRIELTSGPNSLMEERGS